MVSPGPMVSADHPQARARPPLPPPLPPRFQIPLLLLKCVLFSVHAREWFRVQTFLGLKLAPQIFVYWFTHLRNVIIGTGTSTQDVGKNIRLHH